MRTVKPILLTSADDMVARLYCTVLVYVDPRSAQSVVQALQGTWVLLVVHLRHDPTTLAIKQLLVTSKAAAKIPHMCI